MAQLQPTVVSGTLNALRTENEKTTSHSLELADRDRVVAFTGSGAQTVTVPNDTTVNFPVGSVVFIARFGAGTLTLAAAGGVNVTRTGTFGPNEEIYVRKRAANSWVTVDSPRSVLATGGTLVTASGFRHHTFTGTTDTLIVG